MSLCCINLKTTGKIISWTSLVVSLAFTILNCILLHNYKSSDELIYGLSVMVTIGLLDIIFSGLLVLGTIMERNLLILPWLIFSANLLALCTVINLYWVIINMAISPQFHEIGYFFLRLILIGFGVYITSVIYSLYKQIKHSNKQKYSLNQGAIPMSNPATNGNASFVKV
ncbi:uncharacterized protein LOC117784966 [Drosophila innubila]|uniref:uncharacterized protein LOC117784966 n=1 Tax=Drosophila innubila TaxID=198719 RepID=UPI00148DB0C1|nr:uncharacterized protein LOC117784966 [Drosophila innubila]